MHYFNITLGYAFYVIAIGIMIFNTIIVARSKNANSKYYKHRSLTAGLSVTTIILLIIDAIQWTMNDYRQTFTIITMFAIIFFIASDILSTAINDDIEATITHGDTQKKWTNKKATKLAVTHAGMFHADDVFSFALLQLDRTSKKEKYGYILKRVNNASDIPADADIVFDIGGGKFDHHQNLDKYHELNNQQIPYASFGLLWDEYGMDIVNDFTQRLSLTPEAKDAIFKKFEKSLVVPIDANDNGIFTDDFSVSQVIRDLNDNAGSDAAFYKAEDLAFSIIVRRLTSITNQQLKSDAILKLSEFITPEIAILPQHGPWSQLAKDHPELKLVIYESNRGGFNINTVSDKTDDGQSIDRFVIPQSAAKLPHVTFVHKNGFIMVTDSLDNAIAAAKTITKSED